MTIARFFREPSTIKFGLKAAMDAGPEAKRSGATRALLVTDEVLINNGTTGPVLESLKTAGLDPVVFSGVNSEPTLSHVQAGLEMLKAGKCDVLVACGGGSSIDTAKAISIMATNPGAIQEYMGIDKVVNSGLPLIAIPTTAGTGSEVTMVTIITDTDRDVKMLIGSPELMPTSALVDPLMTMKMPRHLTAATGLDALTHAIEAYVSVKSQPMSDIMALSAVELLGRYLPQAWSNPDNIEARSMTLLGAMQAGIAFSNSSVALVHGMSRPIGAYFHVAHGVSNAALLGIVMDFSLMGATNRYAVIAEKLGVAMNGLSALDAARAGADRVKEMIQMLKVPSLSALGVTKAMLDKLVSTMADDAIASGSPGNNPRKATKEEIIQLYYDAL
ncbi:MAG: iron-containing alcohol dehydrogenase [Desulfobacterales bacterium]|nr:iron-containing alcohol dehydrogenase [Desulfobacterales bacterium]MDD4072709.1 iron-containing alcohol dehydrogenase [Desulfobacterales bacterium]MDD4393118.1 iron-containing alcohol dehydrogenase [Desulfobacterales bacterium]